MPKSVFAPAIVGALLLAGCNTHQSALSPFGLEARETRDLTLFLVCAGVAIFCAMVLLYRHAVRAPENSLSLTGAMRFILWAGAILPTLLLTALLVHAVPAMRPIESEPGDLVVRVDGEQFWWRVAYDDGSDAAPLVTANEVRIPTGRTVVFELDASDVIHSFWIPGLAGKMDMIPGRTNTLVVKAEKAGSFRGVCTEFCGLSHALMAFDVIAMEPAAFDRWLESQRGPSRAATTQGAGSRLFAEYGCGACHAIRGTLHDAAIGPDLSRFGTRATLGAGIMDPDLDNIAAFIQKPQDAKPGARMPTYAQMPRDDALAIARYLKSLK